MVVVRRLMSLVIWGAAVTVLGIIACGQEPTPLPPPTVAPLSTSTAAAIGTPVPVPDTPSPTEPVATATPQAAPTTAPTPRPTLVPPPTPTAPPVPSPTAEPNLQPTLAPEPTATPTPPTLALALLSPQDGVSLEAPALRVLGETIPGAVVTVNEIPADVGDQGRFQIDLSLEQGLNAIDVVATDQLGRTESRQVEVSFDGTTEPLPFSILYPPDGLEVGEPQVQVLGVTRPDAIVAANSVSAEMNALGIFSTSLDLEDGANLVEVLATDIDGNVRFETIVVFYTP